MLPPNNICLTSGGTRLAGAGSQNRSRPQQAAALAHYDQPGPTGAQVGSHRGRLRSQPGRIELPPIPLPPTPATPQLMQDQVDLLEPRGRGPEDAYPEVVSGFVQWESPADPLTQNADSYLDVSILQLRINSGQKGLRLTHAGRTTLSGRVLVLSPCGVQSPFVSSVLQGFGQVVPFSGPGWLGKDGGCKMEQVLPHRGRLWCLAYLL